MPETPKPFVVVAGGGSPYVCGSYDTAEEAARSLSHEDQNVYALQRFEVAAHPSVYYAVANYAAPGHPYGRTEDRRIQAARLRAELAELEKIESEQEAAREDLGDEEVAP